MRKILVFIIPLFFILVSCKEEKSPFTRDVENYAVVDIKAADMYVPKEISGPLPVHLFAFDAIAVVDLVKVVKS